MLCAIHQPQFIPWLGYFAKIDLADRFVLLDTVQYKKNEWQNRNKIKAGEKSQWLTIPVTYRFPQKMDEVKINNREKWKKKHLQTLRTYYSKTPFFKKVFPIAEEIYREETDSFRDFVVRQINILTEVLGIDTPVFLASQLELPERENKNATEYLIQICRHLKCDEYLSGAGGKNYLSESSFQNEGILLKYQKYVHPRYSQPGGEFFSHLSVLDLLFNEGDESLKIIRSGNR